MPNQAAPAEIVKRKYTEDEIMTKIDSSERWAVNAMLALDKNNLFEPKDVPVFSSIINIWKDTGEANQRQLTLIRIRIKRSYLGKLKEIADLNASM